MASCKLFKYSVSTPPREGLPSNLYFADHLPTIHRRCAPGYDFDFWINVVSIRGSEKEKEARKKKIDFYGIKEAVSNEEEDERQDHVWGLMRKKSWLSIEDPFEIDRILGTNAKGQERLTYLDLMCSVN